MLLSVILGPEALFQGAIRCQQSWYLLCTCSGARHCCVENVFLWAQSPAVYILAGPVFSDQHQRAQQQAEHFGIWPSYARELKCQPPQTVPSPRICKLPSFAQVNLSAGHDCTHSYPASGKKDYHKSPTRSRWMMATPEGSSGRELARNVLQANYRFHQEDLRVMWRLLWTAIGALVESSTETHSR